MQIWAGVCTRKDFNLGWRLQIPCLQASDRCTSVTYYLQPVADHLASGVVQETRKSVRSNISNFITEKRRREREVHQGASFILSKFGDWGGRFHYAYSLVASCHVMAVGRDVVVADRNSRSIWEFHIGNGFSRYSFQRKRPNASCLPTPRAR